MTQQPPTKRPDRITLSEYDTSDPVVLSDTALDGIDALNRDMGGNRIDVEFGRGETVRLQTSQYVGTVALPDGPEIRITPKAAGTNFLELLRLAYGIPPLIDESPVEATTGHTFVDTIALLFVAELETILRHGPHTEYQWVDERMDSLRGRLDLPRQLQHQVVAGTEFEVTYEDLTADTVANRGIHRAADRLIRLVDDQTLASHLRQLTGRLARWVSNEPVTPAELATIETTRLNSHYETILNLSEQILRQRYLDDFHASGHLSFGLLINMNSIFERVVERIARNCVAPQSEWRVKTQDRIQSIATGGTPQVNMYPDFVLEQRGTPRLVGDAKWKTNTINQSDVYQMSAYMLALETPGVLVYPEQSPGVTVETTYLIDERFELKVIELPTRSSPSGREFENALREVVRDNIFELVDLADNMHQ